MQFNAGSNALIVRDTESKLVVLKQLVEGLDLEVPQVQIEARIVQADTVYARGLGIQWGFQAGNRTLHGFLCPLEYYWPIWTDRRDGGEYNRSKLSGESCRLRSVACLLSHQSAGPLESSLRRLCLGYAALSRRVARD